MRERRAEGDKGEEVEGEGKGWRRRGERKEKEERGEKTSVEHIPIYFIHLHLPSYTLKYPK